MTDSIFETDLVKTRVYSKKLILVFLLLYLISLFVIYPLGDNQYPKYIIITSFVLNLSGLYIMFLKDLIKPKVVGKLKISYQTILIEQSNQNLIFHLNDVNEVLLNYMDYGSWQTQTIYGNKNFLKISDKQNKICELEFLIKNKNAKNNLKSILSQPEFDGKFKLVKHPHSKTNF